MKNKVNFFCLTHVLLPKNFCMTHSFRIFFSREPPPHFHQSTLPSLVENERYLMPNEMCAQKILIYHNRSPQFPQHINFFLNNFCEHKMIYNLDCHIQHSHTQLGQIGYSNYTTEQHGL